MSFIPHYKHMHLSLDLDPATPWFILQSTMSHDPPHLRNLGAGAGLLIPVPLDVLLVIRQRHIEIKRLIPLTEPEPYEGVLPAPILDP